MNEAEQLKEKVLEELFSLHKSFYVQLQDDGGDVYNEHVIVFIAREVVTSDRLNDLAIMCAYDLRFEFVEFGTDLRIKFSEPKLAFDWVEKYHLVIV